MLESPGSMISKATHVQRYRASLQEGQPIAQAWAEVESHDQIVEEPRESENQMESENDKIDAMTVPARGARRLTRDEKYELQSIKSMGGTTQKFGRNILVER